MKKTYRLDFITKRPSSLQSAWKDLLRENILRSNLGVLTGRFLEDSPELNKVLAAYNRDKEALGVRMESSCIVHYEQNDFDSCSLFKFYPKSVETQSAVSRTISRCHECGRSTGANPCNELVLDTEKSFPCALGITMDGDLLIHRRLVEEVESRTDSSDYVFDRLVSSNNKSDWSVVMHAPKASRINNRLGFCNTCGGAVKSDSLPDVDEIYLLPNNRHFILSPDRPSLPCFSKEIATWLVKECPELSWGMFKPIEVLSA